MAKSTSKLFESEEPKEMQADAMNLPEEKDEETKIGEATEQFLKDKLKENERNITGLFNPPADEIQDINLSATQKKRFRINGDPNKILELNTSDLGIASRLNSAYDRLVKHMEHVGEILAGLSDEEETDEIFTERDKTILAQLKAIDEEMKKEVDFIFDAPVSDICSDGGSMYDPFNGMFRYEHIIDALTSLYETNINREFNAMRRRVNSKTSKYTKKFHR